MGRRLQKGLTLRSVVVVTGRRARWKDDDVMG